MAGRAIELDDDGAVVIRFPYHPTVVDVVRGLSRRSFDRLNKCWSAPAEALVEVVDTLVPHGFAVAAPAREAYVARGGTQTLASGLADEGAASGTACKVPTPSLFGGDAACKALPPSAATPAIPPVTSLATAATAATAAPDSWTVSALNARVSQVLRAAFPERLWVVGEIAGFERSRHRPNAFFELVEKASEAEGGDVRAKVSVVLFATARKAVERKLAAADAPFELKDGLEVRVAVRVELYAPRGSYQLVVEDVDPVHTLGRIAQDRAAVLAELDRRGLRTRNQELPWPLVPLRVALITSKGSDAYNDFVQELGRSGYAFAITVADTRVQGAGLERGLTAALRRFAARAADFDVVAIVRGGGAKTDLMGFDHLQVALAVASSPLKVVAGIGHQRDVSVVDLVSHSEKTPTAAAAAIVAHVADFEQRLVDGAAGLRDAMARALPAERERLRRLAADVAAGADAAGRGARERLAAARARLAPALLAGLRGERDRVATARDRLAQLARGQARLRASLLAKLAERFEPARLRAPLARRTARIADLELRAAALHPQATLRRGFAIVRDATGKTVRDAAKLAAGTKVQTALARGGFDATVIQIRRDGDGA